MILFGLLLLSLLATQAQWRTVAFGLQMSTKLYDIIVSRAAPKILVIQPAFSVTIFVTQPRSRSLVIAKS